MLEYLSSIFSTAGFMPHGHCYLWTPSLLWIQVLSNGLIGLAYISISVSLAYLVYRVRDIPFQWMYLAFGLFIITCGFTHLMDVWVIWKPDYWTDGAIRILTAIASVGTAIILPPLVPKAVALAQGAKAAHARGIRLESAYRQLGEVFEKTRELDTLKTQFFANVSHELRTPLALILGPANRMKTADNLTPTQQRDLEIMTRNAQILLKHVNDLLDIAKLEAGRMRVAYARLDLAKLLRITAGNFDGLARDRGITFLVNAPSELHVECDPDLLQRILLNLLSNAIKFVPEKGAIEVLARGTTTHVQVSVADSGPGIPASLRERVFDRFRQIDEGPTRRHGGTGLGLSIAKEFVELHHGKIRIEDSPFGGAMFVFELPIRAPEGVNVAIAPIEPLPPDVARREFALLRESAQKLEAAPSRAPADRGTILIVEDNLDMNRFISEILSVEYRTESAYDGREGLEKALRLQPDLILTDIMMPVMSGDQMIFNLRKIPELAAVPILLLTAKADDELRDRLLSEGVQDYVLKPFSSAEVMARVRNLVTIKRVRSALQREIHSQLQDLEVLARELTRQKHRLQEMVGQLRTAKEEAERASQAKSTFLGMVSHEIKTPMTILQLHLDLLKRTEGKNLNTRQLQLVNKLEQSSKRSIELINNLLEYTRLRSGKIEPRTTPIELSIVLSELVETFRPQAQEKGLQLNLSLPSRPPPLLVSDPLLVEMVIRNLITNAIKYTDVGFVEVRLSYEKARHLVTVRDSGPGIPKEQQKTVFQAFEQLAPLERKTKPGFGLGLSIARESVHAVGGEISLTSEVGKGSTFVVSLPSLERKS